MAANLNETASITLRIEGDAARNQLALLEGEARKLDRALKETAKGSQQWADLYKEVGKNTDAQKGLRDQLGLTGLTLKQLQTESKSLVKEISNLTPGTEAFVAKSTRLQEVKNRMADVRAESNGISTALGHATASLEDWDNESKRATLTVKQLKEVAAQLNDEIDQLVPGTKEHAAAVEKQTAVNKQLGNTLQEQPSRWKRIQDAVVSFVGAFSLWNVVSEGFAFIKQGVTSALQLSDALADVSKSTGMSTAEVKGLAAALDQIDTRTTKEGLLDIAKVGGQLGIANEQLLGFVESVDKAVVALGDEFTGGAEEAAKEIGALQKLFKETKDLKAGDAINNIGSALNSLGAAGSATAPVVADFAQRIGQLGDLAPEIGQTLGLGAAFQELGLTAEISASGISNILLTAAKSTDLFAQQLGISEAQMKKLINTKPGDFLQKLAISLKGVPADQLATRLYDLGIKSQEATKVMALMKDQTDLVAQKQQLANKSLKEGTSLTDEFNIKNKTANAEYEKSQKRVAQLAIEIGTGLLPYVTKTTTAVIAFVNIIRALPDFVRENKTELALLGGALLAFNGQLIASTASSIAHAAAEKARLIWTESATVAQRVLNATLVANPIGAVVGVILLLVGAFVTLYNNSLTVRAGVAGLFEALKVAGSQLLQFWQAIKNLDFAQAGQIMWDGGKKMAAAFSKGYQDTIAQENKKDLQTHQKQNDQKKAASQKAAQETGQLVALEDEKTHNQKAKQADSARKKEAAASQKAISETTEAKRQADIAAIKDETERELAKLQWKRDKEVAAIQASKASNKEKNEAIAAQDQLLKAEQEKVNREHLEKIKADQQKALDLEREMRLQHETDANKRAKLDADYKYAQEKERIAKEVKDEAKKAQLLTLAQANYNQGIEKLNTETRNRERESSNFIRQQEQAAKMAQFDWEERAAGSNASKLLEIKQRRLKAEFDNTLANLQAEKAAEVARIAESNLSQDQKAAQQIAINGRYLAEVTAANRNYDADMRALDEQHLQQKRERWNAYSNAFKSLLSGDVSSFVSSLQQMTQLDAEHQNQKLRRASETADQVGEIAKAGVAFLNKLTQERLDREIAASKKETDTKLADNQTRMEAAIKAAEDQAAKEKAAAGDSAEAQQAIEEKLATSKASIREQFEDEAEGIRQEATSKEKALAIKKWEADKKAQIATALISGAQAALKALASGIFPVNLIFAGVTAGLTAIQIAKIKNQPAPTFADGGAFTVDSEGIIPMYGEGGIDWSTVPDRFGRMFNRGGRGFVRNAGVLQGGRHGGRYGQKGIAMIDRESGREVGEAEGGEPFMILSRNTYANNRPVIDRLLYSSMYRNGQKIAYRDGGVGGGSWGVGTIGETPYYSRGMYLFGSKKAKREAAAAQAEAEAAAAKAQAEADAMVAGYSSYDGPSSYDEGDANGTAQASGYSADAEAQAQKAAQMAQDQLELLEDIGKAVVDMSEDLQKALTTMNDDLVLAMSDLADSNQLALEKLSTQTIKALADLDVHTQEGLADLITTTQETSDQLATSQQKAINALSSSLNTSVDGMAQQVSNLRTSISGVESAVNRVEGAVNGVTGAVWGTNQAGRLDALIAAISSLK